MSVFVLVCICLLGIAATGAALMFLMTHHCKYAAVSLISGAALALIAMGAVYLHDDVSQQGLKVNTFYNVSEDGEWPESK